MTKKHRRTVGTKRGRRLRTPTARLALSVKVETLADLQHRSAETGYSPSTLARVVLERGLAMGLLGDRAYQFTIPFTHGRAGVDEVVKMMQTRRAAIQRQQDELVELAVTALRGQQELIQQIGERARADAVEAEFLHAVLDMLKPPGTTRDGIGEIHRLADPVVQGALPPREYVRAALIEMVEHVREQAVHKETPKAITP